MSIRTKYIVTFVFCPGAERASSMGVSSVCGRDLAGPMPDIAFRAESTAESILRSIYELGKLCIRVGT